MNLQKCNAKMDLSTEAKCNAALKTMLFSTIEFIVNAAEIVRFMDEKNYVLEKQFAHIADPLRRIYSQRMIPELMLMDYPQRRKYIAQLSTETQKKVHDGLTVEVLVDNGELRLFPVIEMDTFMLKQVIDLNQGRFRNPTEQGIWKVGESNKEAAKKAVDVKEFDHITMQGANIVISDVKGKPLELIAKIAKLGRLKRSDILDLLNELPK